MYAERKHPREEKDLFLSLSLSLFSILWRVVVPRTVPRYPGETGKLK